MSSPEVDNNLFIFLHVNGIVVFVPLMQMLYLLPVVGFLIVSDEAHHCGVLWNCVDVVDAVGWYAVVSTQGKEQQVEHAPLWSPCSQHDGVGLSFQSERTAPGCLGRNPV